MSLRPEDDEHLVPLHAWPRFNFTNIREVLLQFLEYPRTQLTVTHLAAAKPDRGFHFVAILQSLSRMLHAIVVVVIVCSRAKLNFLDRDCYLLLLRLVCLLLRFVLELSKIDDPAHRGIGIRSNLDQIEPFVTGRAHSVAHVHYAELFSFFTNHAHLRHANSFVNTNRRPTPVVRTLTATSKACSYCCTSWFLVFDARFYIRPTGPILD